MGCQRAIAEPIRSQEENYLLALKGNQSGLLVEMQTLFEHGINTDFEGMEKTEYSLSETGHGRKACRMCVALSIPQGHPQPACWKDLNTVVAMTTERVVGEKETRDTRYYISNLSASAKDIAKAIRRHGSIENSRHWILDVAYQEDRRRQTSRNISANVAAIRRLTVSVLRQEKINKRGIKKKRFACALDTSYLMLCLKTAKI
ncbi:MAG TPA: ISAs1 family transposase [Pirellulaceae bacterium]|nr:ISAs1 family transposase [Pirellulaceae bacterium]